MINYATPEILTDESIQHDLLMTDGTVTVSGTNYTVTGATVTIDNGIIESESFSLKQSLNSGSQLQFGSCEAGEISFVIHENIPTIKGKTLKVYLIPDNDASKMLQLGVYKVYEDKLSADRTRRSIVAYDALYDIINADVAAWYNSELPNSSTTKTLAQFRADFLNHFGITAESATLVNDGITVKRTIEPETLSGADVIRWICEIEGCFGQINNVGNFKYVVLSSGLDDGLFPSDTLYPANDLYPQDVNLDVDPIPKSRYINVEFEDYNAESITGLTIRTNDSDVGVTVGSQGNVYVITGNPLVYGCNAATLQTVATNALANMENRYYRPCTVNALGNPLHEVGDGIRISTTYRGVVTYILERTLSGIQALRDTYVASGEQYYTEKLNSVTSQFKQLSGKVASLKVESDGIESRVEDIEDGSATVIQQLSNAISSKVSTSTFNSEVSQLSNQISAKVSETGGSASSFAYELTASNFKLVSGNNTVFLGNSSGVEVKGSFFCSGNYGSVDIDNGHIAVESGYDRTDIRGDRIVIDDVVAMTTNGFFVGNNKCLTTGDSISSSQIYFNKNIDAHGTTGTYTLTLQTININGTGYVMYAYER